MLVLINYVSCFLKVVEVYHLWNLTDDACCLCCYRRTKKSRRLQYRKVSTDVVTAKQN